MQALPLRPEPGRDLRAADALGRVTGGHVEYGCVVRTTVEILVALLPAHQFSRQADPLSGFKELIISPHKAA